jgi:periplasmic divalent cation tolerance protein
MESISHKGEVVILSTAPRGEGDKIARIMVQERLAACVNILTTRSLFRWEGRVQKEEEVLLLIKTSSEKVPETMKKIRELHPYEIPEMIVLPIIGGYEPYLRWIQQETM